MISIYIYITYTYCAIYEFCFFHVWAFANSYFVPQNGNSKKIETLAVFLVFCLMDAPWPHLEVPGFTTHHPYFSFLLMAIRYTLNYWMFPNPVELKLSTRCKSDSSSDTCDTLYCFDTVDGWNPAPVDVVDIPVFIGFYTSQVVQDFFHQQYQQ